MKFLLSFLVIAYFNVELAQAQFEKQVTITNWTAFGTTEQNHSGAVRLHAICFIRRGLSAPIHGETNVEVGIKAELLIPTNVQNWQKGTMGCENVNGIELAIEISPFNLYRNGKPVPKNRQGYPLIGEDCQKKKYIAHVRYLPATHYDQPTHGEDPMGHYAVYEWCQ